MKLGFTGTREGLTLPQADALWHVLKKLKPEYFHHGMCVGADEHAHDFMRSIGVMIIGYPPTMTTYKMKVKLDEFWSIRDAAPYMERNRAIVKDTEHLVACPKGPEELRSGTWSTVRFARKAMKPITIAWPDGSVTEENPPLEDYWYRFEDQRCSVCIDPDADYYGSELRVEMRKYKVIKATPEGVWLSQGFGDKRFCRRNSRKRFACPTIEEAKESFIARKNRQASIHQSMVDDAKKAISIVKSRVFA